MMTQACVVQGLRLVGNTWERLGLARRHRDGRYAAEAPAVLAYTDGGAGTGAAGRGTLRGRR